MLATIAFILQFAALIIMIVFLFRAGKGNKISGDISPYLLLLSAVLLLTDLVVRSIQINFIAITNTYESLVFFSAVIMIVLAAGKLRFKDRFASVIVFGGTVVSLALLAVASSPIAPDTIRPPIPALQSWWLVLHVTFAFIGEAFFVVAFVSSIMLLATKNEDKRAKLDKTTYTAIAVGYPIFTAGALIFGAVWAANAWGSFWSWDPKETWALITWLTYTLYLHVRLYKKLKGPVSAWISIVAFLFTLFTFFGVNFLLSGLHSYG